MTARAAGSVRLGLGVLAVLLAAIGVLRLSREERAEAAIAPAPPNAETPRDPARLAAPEVGPNERGRAAEPTPVAEGRLPVEAASRGLEEATIEEVVAPPAAEPDTWNLTAVLVEGTDPFALPDDTPLQVRDEFGFLQLFGPEGLLVRQTRESRSISATDLARGPHRITGWIFGFQGIDVEVLPPVGERELVLEIPLVPELVVRVRAVTSTGQGLDRRHFGWMEGLQARAHDDLVDRVPRSYERSSFAADFSPADSPEEVGRIGRLAVHGPLPVYVSLVAGEQVFATEVLAAPRAEVVFVVHEELLAERWAHLEIEAVDAATDEPIETFLVILHQGRAAGMITPVEGRVRLPRTAPGELVLEVSAEGYGTHRERLRLEPGDEELVRAELERAELREVLVLLPDGSAARGATIHVAPSSDFLGSENALQIFGRLPETGSDGRCHVPVGKGEQVVRARWTSLGEDHASRVAVLRPEEEEVTLLHLLPTVRFEVRLVTELQGRDYELVQLPEGLPALAGTFTTRNVNLSVVPGRYRLDVLAKGEGAAARSFEVGIDEDGESLSLAD